MSSGRTWNYLVIRDHVTPERLSSYLSATNGDLVRAFELYEWNMTAAAGVLTTTAMVEVVVRNALDEQLRRWAEKHRAASSWFDAAPMDPRGRATSTRRDGEQPATTADPRSTARSSPNSASGSGAISSLLAI